MNIENVSIIYFCRPQKSMKASQFFHEINFKKTNLWMKFHFVFSFLLDSDESFGLKSVKVQVKTKNKNHQIINN